MTKERWQEIKIQVKNNFEIIDQYQEELDPGAAEVLEFVGPQGKIKLKFITKPKLLDKKTMYSNRAGSGVKVDYVYSPDETVNYLEVWQWSDSADDWHKLEGESLFQ